MVKKSAKPRARFCAPSPDSNLWNCPARKFAAALPESTMSRKRKRLLNCWRRKCTAPNPRSPRLSQPPIPVACCSFALEPRFTEPINKSSTSSNSSTEACAHESHKCRATQGLRFVTSLHRRIFLSRNDGALPAAIGLLRKGRLVFRREDRVDRITVARNEVAESIFRGRWRRLLE